MKHWVYWKELCDEFLKVLCTEWAPPRFSEEVLQWYGHSRLLGIPISKTLVIWASPCHITSATWVRFRVTGDAHITILFEMGMPERRDVHITAKEASLCHEGAGESRKESARGAWYFFNYFCVVFVILSGSFCGGKRYSTLTKKCVFCLRSPGWKWITSSKNWVTFLDTNV